jgi:hypothetical protein
MNRGIERRSSIGRDHEQPRRRRLPGCFRKAFGRFVVNHDPLSVTQPDVLVHVSDGAVSIGVTDLSSPVSTRPSALVEIYALIQEQKADEETGGIVFAGVSREAEESLSR